MPLKHDILTLLKEHKEKGEETVKLKSIVEEIVKMKKYHISSVYKEIKQLELEGKIEIINDGRYKLIKLKNET